MWTRVYTERDKGPAQLYSGPGAEYVEERLGVRNQTSISMAKPLDPCVQCVLEYTPDGSTPG